MSMEGGEAFADEGGAGSLANPTYLDPGRPRAVARWKRAFGKVALFGKLGLIAKTARDGGRAGANATVLLGAIRQLVCHVKRCGLSLPQLFAQIDTDSGGTIDTVEFRMGVTKIGLRFDDQQIAALMAHIDQDGDGELTSQEFCKEIEQFIEAQDSTGPAILSKLCHYLAETHQTAEELFTKLDTDGTGALDAKELHAALAEIGINVSLRAAKAAMLEFDLDGDGQLEIGELNQLLEEFMRQRRVCVAGVLGCVLDYVKETKTSVVRVFARADQNGTGDLDTLELQFALQRMGQGLSEIEVLEIIRELTFGTGLQTESMTCSQFLDCLKHYQSQRAAYTVECETLFKELDGDDSGTLDKDELRLLAQKLGLGEQLKEEGFLDKLMTEILRPLRHREAHHTVRLDQLLPWFLTTGRSYLPQPVYQTSADPDNPSEEDLQKLFSHMDKDGSGAVELAEVQRVCVAVWPYLDPRSSNIAFAAADSDGDGEVALDEFSALFRCLHFLNRHRHNVDEIEENFPDGLELDEFYLGCNIMQLELSEKQQKLKYDVLCARFKTTVVTVEQFISWCVKNECMDKLMAEAAQEESQVRVTSELKDMAGEFGEIFFEDLAKLMWSEQRALATGKAKTKMSKGLKKLQKGVSEMVDRLDLLERGIIDAFERNESFPGLTSFMLRELVPEVSLISLSFLSVLSHCSHSSQVESAEVENYYAGQNVMTEGALESTFCVLRRGKAEVLKLNDDGEEEVLDMVMPGHGVGELGLVFGMKRVATVRCTGPCEWFIVTRASYETAIALLPTGARSGGLATIMKKFWALVTGPDGTNSDVVDYKAYLKLATRISKTLTAASDMADYDDDEILATAQEDWAADCKRWNIKVTDTLDMPMFLNGMYELVDLWAADLDVSFYQFLSMLFENIAVWVPGPSEELGTAAEDTPKQGSPREGGHWIFQQMKDVKGVGEKFDEIRDEAQAAQNAAEALHREAEGDREKARKREEMENTVRQARLKAMRVTKLAATKSRDARSRCVILSQILTSPHPNLTSTSPNLVTGSRII